MNTFLYQSKYCLLKLSKFKKFLYDFLKKSEIFFQKNKKAHKHLSMSFLFYVVPPGIEPGTPGFSVLCSTI